jgi:hypothetical protein
MPPGNTRFQSGVTFIGFPPCGVLLVQFALEPFGFTVGSGVGVPVANVGAVVWGVP